mgnify:CR=1 FL=1|jgi:hypothetical protein
MATGDYTYAATQQTFSTRDGLASGNADKTIKGIYHEIELQAIETAMDNQMNTNSPVMAGTLSTGTINGGTF